MPGHKMPGAAMTNPTRCNLPTKTINAGLTLELSRTVREELKDRHDTSCIRKYNGAEIRFRLE